MPAFSGLEVNELVAPSGGQQSTGHQELFMNNNMNMNNNNQNNNGDNRNNNGNNTRAN